MRYYSLTFVFGVIFLILSCQTSLKAQATNEEKAQIAVSDISIVTSLDSVDTSTFKGELSEIDVFGRKILYGDLSQAKSATTVSGKVSFKVCINRAGLVTYIELNQTETTIDDRQTLKKWLNAAYNFKFQPDLSAPKEQCGKMSFSVDN